MKKLLAAVVMFGMAGVASADKPAAPKKAVEEKKAPAAAGDKLTGEVVDITCFSASDGKGEKHASCAQKCLGAGMPAGLLSDGKLYVVVMKDHTAPSAKLAAWGGKTVNATGKKMEKMGTNVFEIDTVEAATK